MSFFVCDELTGMQGISTSVLQEYLHNLEGRKGQVSPVQMRCVLIWRCNTLSRLVLVGMQHAASQSQV